MSSLTVGAVVDVATARGLGTVIVTSINQDEIKGWEVTSHDHATVLREFTGIRDEVLFYHDNERGMVINVGNDVIAVLVDDEEDRALLRSPSSRDKHVTKSAHQIASGIMRALEYEGDTAAADEMRKYQTAYTSHIASTLALPDIQ